VTKYYQGLSTHGKVSENCMVRSWSTAEHVLQKLMCRRITRIPFIVSTTPHRHAAEVNIDRGTRRGSAYVHCLYWKRVCMRQTAPYERYVDFRKLKSAEGKRRLRRGEGTILYWINRKSCQSKGATENVQGTWDTIATRDPPKRVKNSECTKCPLPMKGTTHLSSL